MPETTVIFLTIKSTFRFLRGQVRRSCLHPRKKPSITQTNLATISAADCWFRYLVVVIVATVIVAFMVSPSMIVPCMGIMAIVRVIVLSLKT